MYRFLSLAFASVGLLAAVQIQVQAAPAPWYLWRSISGGDEACAQTSPGEGWAKSGGPFIDSACRRRLRVVPL